MSVCTGKSRNLSEKFKLPVSSSVHIYRVFSANQLKNLICNTHMTGDEYLEQVGCLLHHYQRENSWLCTCLYLCVTEDEYLPYHMEVSTWRYKVASKAVYMNVASSLVAKHH